MTTPARAIGQLLRQAGTHAALRPATAAACKRQSRSTTVRASSSSSSRTTAPPPPRDFPCVDANEARGERLRQVAEAASASSAASSSVSESACASGSQSLATPAFPCVDANEAREIRLRSQGPAIEAARSAAASPDETGPEPAYANIVSGYQIFKHDAPFALDYGGELPSFQLAYETWGELNADRSNVILVHTGLSASSHAASTAANPAKGWWEAFIGPGKPLDTDRYFVICTNVLGGCYGSTGPSSPHPNDPTGAAWATRFPLLSIFDMVRAQFKLLDHLGVQKLYASLGSSMGGMQSVAAAHLEPERVERVVSISGCARSGPSSIALRYAQRSVLMSDPNWNRGFYYSPGQLPPHTGMKLARQIATITYRSGPEWEQRFGRARRRMPDAQLASLQANATSSDASLDLSGPRQPPSVEQDPALCPDFLIETYLDHQGEQFCLKYDANSLIYISKAMDLFDMSDHSLADLERRRARGREPTPDVSATAEATPRLASADTAPAPSVSRQRQHISTLSSPFAHAYAPSLARGLSRLARTPTLIIGVQSDILFPVDQQRELAECLRRNGNERISYYELDAPHGHDSFLIDTAGVGGAIRGFLG